eukprot:292334-Alexandrium_andersonii.AAC.1
MSLPDASLAPPAGLVGDRGAAASTAAGGPGPPTSGPPAPSCPKGACPFPCSRLWAGPVLL